MHTCPQAEEQREQRSRRAEVKFTHSEEKSAETLRSTQQGGRSQTPTFISFSVLCMVGGLFFFFFFEVQFLYNIVQQSFGLGWNSHRGEG